MTQEFSTEKVLPRLLAAEFAGYVLSGVLSDLTLRRVRAIVSMMILWMCKILDELGGGVSHYSTGAGFVHSTSCPLIILLHLFGWAAVVVQLTQLGSSCQ